MSDFLWKTAAILALWGGAGVLLVAINGGG